MASCVTSEEWGCSSCCTRSCLLRNQADHAESRRPNRVGLGVICNMRALCTYFREKRSLRTGFSSRQHYPGFYKAHRVSWLYSTFYASMEIVYAHMVMACSTILNMLSLSIYSIPWNSTTSLVSLVHLLRVSLGFSASYQAADCIRCGTLRCTDSSAHMAHILANCHESISFNSERDRTNMSDKIS